MVVFGEIGLGGGGRRCLCTIIQFAEARAAEQKQTPNLRVAQLAQFSHDHTHVEYPLSQTQLAKVSVADRRAPETFMLQDVLHRQPAKGDGCTREHDPALGEATLSAILADKPMAITSACNQQGN